MLHIVELPKSGTAFSCLLLDHCVRRMKGHASGVEGRECKPTGDEDVGKIQPLDTYHGVTGNECGVGAGRNRSADRMGVLDVGSEHEQGCLSTVAFLPGTICVGGSTQARLNTVEPIPLSCVDPGITRLERYAGLKVEISLRGRFQPTADKSQGGAKNDRAFHWSLILESAHMPKPPLPIFSASTRSGRMGDPSGLAEILRAPSERSCSSNMSIVSRLPG